MNRLSSTRLAVAVLVASFGVLPRVLAQEPPGPWPSNAVLLAAMPPGTTSVLIIRQELLLADDSALKPELEFNNRHRSRPFPEEGPPTLSDLVTRHYFAGKPVAEAYGGSAFKWPDGVGVGDYVMRSILISARSFAPLQDKLDAGEVLPSAVDTFELEGVTVYSSRYEGRPEAPRRKTILACFPTPHIAVLTETREELQHMVSVLQNPPPQPPARWQAILCELPMEAPVLLLRSLDRGSRRPLSDQEIAARVACPPSHLARSLALALPSAAHVEWCMDCRSRTPERSIRQYRESFPEQRRRYASQLMKEVYAWSTDMRDDGFTATIRLADDEDPPDGVLINLWLLFGLQFAI